ncbi:hypothetical protein HNR60_001155 [Rhodopseudomonas rhenobacensis]|uniref:Porin n=1 Tax=Rhodopseudomonas rhenobacensis TaxID=87461 RepID=A0A7W7Z263_9BRAD|nr:hypothetical protein [Rhodopseudomonas rhenobacensis]MBB5046410.1 hypothetical protein [Rhodopseudomonas rhenobacensis]
MIFAVLVAALPAVAFAEPPIAGVPPARETPRPVPRAAKANPCAAFGPGFVMVEGSSTCVKLGGAISVGGGGRLSR